MGELSSPMLASSAADPTNRIPWHRRVPASGYLAACVVIVALAAVTLWQMGQVPICKCGYVKAWHGVVKSAENSQHLSDWYTFTHVVHGFVFYGLLWLVGRGWPVALRLALAVTIESAWEVFENTDFVINRYREVTISLDYYGDSVLNSVADVAAMIAGFLAAWRLPIALVLALAIGLEAFLAYSIRDNLTLNILMLVHPVEAVRAWQLSS